MDLNPRKVAIGRDAVQQELPQPCWASDAPHPDLHRLAEAAHLRHEHEQMRKLGSPQKMTGAPPAQRAGAATSKGKKKGGDEPNPFRHLHHLLSEISVLLDNKLHLDHQMRNTGQVPAGVLSGGDRAMLTSAGTLPLPHFLFYYYGAMRGKGSAATEATVARLLEGVCAHANAHPRVATFALVLGVGHVFAVAGESASAGAGGSGSRSSSPQRGGGGGGGDGGAAAAQRRRTTMRQDDFVKKLGDEDAEKGLTAVQVERRRRIALASNAQQSRRHGTMRGGSTKGSGGSGGGGGGSDVKGSGGSDEGHAAQEAMYRRDAVDICVELLLFACQELEPDPQGSRGLDAYKQGRLRTLTVRQCREQLRTLGWTDDTWRLAAWKAARERLEVPAPWTKRRQQQLDHDLRRLAPQHATSAHIEMEAVTIDAFVHMVLMAWLREARWQADALGAAAAAHEAMTTALAAAAAAAAEAEGAVALLGSRDLSARPKLSRSESRSLRRLIVSHDAHYKHATAEHKDQLLKEQRERRVRRRRELTQRKPHSSAGAGHLGSLRALREHSDHAEDNELRGEYKQHRAQPRLNWGVLLQAVTPDAPSLAAASGLAETNAMIRTGGGGGGGSGSGEDYRPAVSVADATAAATATVNAAAVLSRSVYKKTVNPFMKVATTTRQVHTLLRAKQDAKAHLMEAEHDMEVMDTTAGAARAAAQAKVLAQAKAVAAAADAKTARTVVEMEEWERHERHRAEERHERFWDWREWQWEPDWEMGGLVLCGSDSDDDHDDGGSHSGSSSSDDGWSDHEGWLARQSNWGVDSASDSDDDPHDSWEVVLAPLLHLPSDTATAAPAPRTGEPQLSATAIDVCHPRFGSGRFADGVDVESGWGGFHSHKARQMHRQEQSAEDVRARRQRRASGAPLSSASDDEGGNGGGADGNDSYNSSSSSADDGHDEAHRFMQSLLPAARIETIDHRHFLPAPHRPPPPTLPPGVSARRREERRRRRLARREQRRIGGRGWYPQWFRLGFDRNVKRHVAPWRLQKLVTEASALLVARLNSAITAHSLGDEGIVRNGLHTGAEAAIFAHGFDARLWPFAFPAATTADGDDSIRLCDYAELRYRAMADGFCANVRDQLDGLGGGLIRELALQQAGLELPTSSSRLKGKKYVGGQTARYTKGGRLMSVSTESAGSWARGFGGFGARPDHGALRARAAGEWRGARARVRVLALLLGLERHGEEPALPDGASAAVANTSAGGRRGGAIDLSPLHDVKREDEHHLAVHPAAAAFVLRFLAGVSASGSTHERQLAVLLRMRPLPPMPVAHNAAAQAATAEIVLMRSPDPDGYDCGVCMVQLGRVLTAVQRACASWLPKVRFEALVERLTSAAAEAPPPAKKQAMGSAPRNQRKVLLDQGASLTSTGAEDKPALLELDLDWATHELLLVWLSEHNAAWEREDEKRACAARAVEKEKQRLYLERRRREYERALEVAKQQGSKPPALPKALQTAEQGSVSSECDEGVAEDDEDGCGDATALDGLWKGGYGSRVAAANAPPRWGCTQEESVVSQRGVTFGSTEQQRDQRLSAGSLPPASIDEPQDIGVGEGEGEAGTAPGAAAMAGDTARVQGAPSSWLRQVQQERSGSASGSADASETAVVAPVATQRPHTAGRLRPSKGTVSGLHVQKQRNHETSQSIARLEAKKRALASHNGLSVLAAFEVGRRQADKLIRSQRPASAPARRKPLSRGRKS